MLEKGGSADTFQDVPHQLVSQFKWFFSKGLFKNYFLCVQESEYEDTILLAAFAMIIKGTKFEEESLTSGSRHLYKLYPCKRIEKNAISYRSTIL